MGGARGQQAAVAGRELASGWGDPRAKEQEEGSRSQRIGRRRERDKERPRLEREAVGARPGTHPELGPAQPCAPCDSKGVQLGPAYFFTVWFWGCCSETLTG